MKTEFIIHSPEEMITLGRRLVSESGYKKFGIIWELGAGKTHFTKGVAMWLWLDDASVHSPTYVYYHVYKDLIWDIETRSSTDLVDIPVLLHIDMYRMVDPMMLVTSWLSDIMEETTYRCVEWPKLDRIDTKGLLTLEILIQDDYTRKVVIDDGV